MIASSTDATPEMAAGSEPKNRCRRRRHRIRPNIRESGDMRLLGQLRQSRADGFGAISPAVDGEVCIAHECDRIRDQLKTSVGRGGSPRECYGAAGHIDGSAKELG